MPSKPGTHFAMRDEAQVVVETDTFCEGVGGPRCSFAGSWCRGRHVLCRVMDEAAVLGNVNGDAMHDEILLRAQGYQGKA